jgi:hypothetical protein
VARKLRSRRLAKEGEKDATTDKKGSDIVSSLHIISVQTVQEEQRTILFISSHSRHTAPSPRFHSAVRKKIMDNFWLGGNRSCETINNSANQVFKLPSIIPETVGFPSLQQSHPCNLMVGGTVNDCLDFWRLEPEPAGEFGHLIDRPLISLGSSRLCQKVIILLWVRGH